MDRYKQLTTGEIQLTQFDFPFQEWLVDKPQCCFCHKKTTKTMTLIAAEDGGPPSPYNVVPCCKTCSKERGSSRLLDWWYKELGRNSTTLPNKVVAGWARLAYARHEVEGSLNTRALGFQDLWKWKDDGAPWWRGNRVLHQHKPSAPLKARERKIAWSLYVPWAGEPTVGELLAWSYACFAAVAFIASKGRRQFKIDDFKYRKSFYHRMKDQKINPRPLTADEKARRLRAQVCVYCGCAEELSMDHLLPQARGGPDEGFNLVLACRRCNSSKGCKDLLAWYEERRTPPPLRVIKRYLKLVIRYCKQNELWDVPVDRLNDANLPFKLSALPPQFLLIAKRSKQKPPKPPSDEQLSLFP